VIRTVTSLQRCEGGATGTKATAGGGLPHVNWFYIIKCPPPLLASTRISSACTLVCTHPAPTAQPLPPPWRPPRLHMTAGAGQHVALVGRVKDCSPDMARVEAADGADVTIKRNG
jgi:hypothetical protein